MLFLTLMMLFLLYDCFFVAHSLANEIDLLFNLCLPIYLYSTRNRAILNIGGTMR